MVIDGNRIREEEGPALTEHLSITGRDTAMKSLSPCSVTIETLGIKIHRASSAGGTSWAGIRKYKTQTLVF